MIKNDLKDYQQYKQLIASYEAELDGDMRTVDTVVGSMRKRPYAKHIITIHGRDVKREQWIWQRLYDLQQKCTHIEAFVAGVEDEHMRALLYWYYIKGLSWPKVRKVLKIRDVASDCLRKRVQNFLKENS